MKILVILKRTPDTETKIVLSSDNKSIDSSDVKYIINPYDEFAIEEALQIKEKVAGSEVVLATFDSPEAKEVVVKGLAMGADRGLLIDSSDVSGIDSLVAAKVLAKAIEDEKADLVLSGKQGIDDDNMHVGTMVAELLSWPHVNVVNKLEIADGNATCEREVEGGQIEVYSVKLPAVFGANKALNSPRYASLPGIMKAKRKPFDIKKPDDYGLNSSELSSQVTTEILGFEYPKEKPAGKIIKGGTVDAMVDELVELLQKEAKVL